jgi:hypothetical protein
MKHGPVQVNGCYEEQLMVKRSLLSTASWPRLINCITEILILHFFGIASRTQTSYCCRDHIELALCLSSNRLSSLNTGYAFPMAYHACESFIESVKWQTSIQHHQALLCNEQRY